MEAAAQLDLAIRRARWAKDLDVQKDKQIEDLKTRNRALLMRNGELQQELNSTKLALHDLKMISRPSFVPRAHIKIERIVKATADHFELEVTEILGKNRSKIPTYARQIATYLACTMTLQSLSVIAHHIGGRDHTTAHHAREKIEILRKADQETEFHITEIKKLLVAPDA